MSNEIKLADEVFNYAVKSDKVLTEDLFKLKELESSISTLIKLHEEESVKRGKENGGVVGNYKLVEKFGKNMFNKELANIWIEKNLLKDRFSVTKPEYVVPAVTEIDFKAVQSELRKRYKETYTSDFCVSKSQGISLERNE